MANTNTKIKMSPIKAHLNRIVGQIAGVSRMIDKKADNLAVLQQIMAVRASLESLAIRILKEEAGKCDRARVDKVVDTLFHLK